MENRVRGEGGVRIEIKSDTFDLNGFLVFLTYLIWYIKTSGVQPCLHSPHVATGSLNVATS
jgi:hypothetical protein